MNKWTVPVGIRRKANTAVGSVQPGSGPSTSNKGTPLAKEWKRTVP